VQEIPEKYGVGEWKSTRRETGKWHSDEASNKDLKERKAMKIHE
jgi:hypothetical protein